ncbi:MAG: beta-glucuronidase, partial [Ruminiclostridium sp.]|nr:beta-glucuronidase [Ruminiclostridium sp.]
LSAFAQGCAVREFSVTEGENELLYDPGAPLPKWDEFTPNVLTLTVRMNGEEQAIPFGLRRLETKGLKLYVNGNETFLRGKHDGMVFPLTGYAPTEVSEWERVFGIAKEYGINHYRFHTCCPPEAAFTAADRLGIYLQPELPFWGTIPDELNDEQRYLIGEGFRMLAEFGNHPSFVMMSLGNELWGNKDILNQILHDYREFDPRHLYTDGSNNFQFFPDVLKESDFLSGVRLSRERLYRGSYAMCDAPLGHIQTCAPNSVHHYDSIIHPLQTEQSTSGGGKILIQYGTGVKEVEADGSAGLIPDVPVISHEVGQYETYPDYRELSHYTGSIRAENIALYREKAEERGLLPLADAFFRASGALAADCYKAELETALRSENLSGFQLLDLQDFPGQGTALVGMLNSLMESKG